MPAETGSRLPRDAGLDSLTANVTGLIERGSMQGGKKRTKDYPPVLDLPAAGPRCGIRCAVSGCDCRSVNSPFSGRNTGNYRQL
jgi:hypothetical protein